MADSRFPAISSSRSASRIVGVATENRSDKSFTLGSRSPGSSASFWISASTCCASCPDNVASCERSRLLKKAGSAN